MRRAPVGGPATRDCNRHRALDEYVTTTHRAPNQLRRRSFRESRSRGSRAAVSSDWCTGDYGKKKKTNPAARAFVADRSSIAICTTTQHSTHSNTTQPHSSQKKKSFLTRPRFLYQDIGVDPKERLPSRVVVPVGASDAAKRRVASRPFFRPRRALNPKPRDACRYLRVDTGSTRTVARRSASASPPRRPRAAGPRARRGASPRDRPTSRGAPEGRSARP